MVRCRGCASVDKRTNFPMKLNLSAERIAQLCAPPAGYVRPATNPEPVSIKKPVVQSRKVKKQHPDRKYAIKQETIDKIQQWRKTHKWHNYREIAEHFGVGLNTAYYALNRPNKNASQP